MASSSETAPATGKRLDYLQWGDYFMATAILASQRSKDPVTQVGACIVDSENRIVAIGYNGFPRNCPDDDFSWDKASKRDGSDSLEDKSLYVVHAEVNAILNKNAADLKDTRLFVTLFPCNECAKLVIQSGIKHIYYLSNKKGHQTKYRAALNMFEKAGVHHEKFKPQQPSVLLKFNYLEEEDTD